VQKGTAPVIPPSTDYWLGCDWARKQRHNGTRADEKSNEASRIHLAVSGMGICMPRCDSAKGAAAAGDETAMRVDAASGRLCMPQKGTV
jgi:hypothetical protein